MIAAPLTALRHELERARRNGQPFDDAWDAAVETALAATGHHHRGSWAIALDATKKAWEDSYHDRGTPLILRPQLPEPEDFAPNGRAIIIR
jgi:hypothetical protein